MEWDNGVSIPDLAGPKTNEAIDGQIKHIKHIKLFRQIMVMTRVGLGASVGIYRPLWAPMATYGQFQGVTSGDSRHATTRNGAEWTAYSSVAWIIREGSEG
jgi:hypothetical protein